MNLYFVMNFEAELENDLSLAYVNNAMAVTARHCFHHHATDEEETTSRSPVETDYGRNRCLK